MRLPKLGNVTHVALVSVLSCFLEGCAGTSPIQLATSSKSAFERAVYKGAKPWPVSAGISGNEAYRVFNQGPRAWSRFSPSARIRSKGQRTFVIARATRSNL